jgi:hypothetical protein
MNNIHFRVLLLDTAQTHQHAFQHTVHKQLQADHVLTAHATTTVLIVVVCLTLTLLPSRLLCQDVNDLFAAAATATTTRRNTRSLTSQCGLL